MRTPTNARAPGIRALRWMLTGFLASFMGSAIIEGASPGLVAAGVLPVVWLPFLATVETTLDLSSPLAVRVLQRVDPGRALVIVEGVDAAACVLCLGLLQVGVAPKGVVVAYLIGASLLPLVIDVAEELYIAQAVRGDVASVARFNAAAFSLSAAVAMLVARPLGAFASAGSLRLVFAANLVLSVTAVVARRRAVRLAPTRPPQELDEEADGAPAGGPSDVARTALSVGWPRTKEWLVRQSRLGAVSPYLSGGLAFAPALYSAYLPLWLADQGRSAKALIALALGAFGLGRVLGPLAAPRLAASMGLARALRRSLAGLAIGLLTTLVASSGVGRSGWGIALMLAMFVLLGVGTSTSLTLLISLRQTQLTGTLLARTVGLAHAFSAAGTLGGVWAGLALAAERRPALALGVASLVMVGATAWLGRHGTASDTGSPPTPEAA